MKRKLLPLAIALCGAMTAAQAMDLTVTVQYGFTTLDPWNASDTLSQSVVKSFYEGLYTFDKDMKVVPGLAAGYEVSGDGLIYTVKLLPGVKFSSGEPFNAAAVKANFDRVLNPDNHLTRYGLYKNIKSVEVVDDLTVKFILHTPFSAFINQLAHPSGGMICPSLLTKTGAEGPAMNACGTGPYLLEKYNPAEYLVVKKNPAYRIAGLPHFDGITWRPTPEDGTRAAMLRTGEAQITTMLNPAQVKVLQGSDNVEVVVGPSVAMRQIYLNNLKKPFTDQRVRQALNYAVNKKALVKVVYQDYAIPSTGPAPANVKYSKQFGEWPYDPKKARELLKEAGYPNGFEATLWSAANDSVNQKLLQFLQQQFAMVGVKVKVRALEAGQRAALIQQVSDPSKSEMQMVTWGWSTSTGEMDWVLRPLLATSSWPPALSNYGYYSNKEVDELLQKALATTDEAQKSAFYAKALEDVWHDAPWVFLSVDKNLYAKDKRLKDFYVLPDGSLQFTQANWQ